MKISELTTFLNEFCEMSTEFKIELKIMNSEHGKDYFRKKITQNVNASYGIYSFFDSEKKDILYLGKAGTVRNDGTYGNQNLIGRLQAPRGGFNNSFLYFKNLMNDNNYENLSFIVYYSKPIFTPAYVEILTLQKYYTRYGCLPRFNNAL
jgi:hypothetical protein